MPSVGIRVTPRLALPLALLLSAFGSPQAAMAAAVPARPAASLDFPIQRLPVNGALTQNSVTSILQDRSGLMWFATLGGVNVYDGYQFRAISSDPRDPDSLSGVSVSRLFEDRSGHIWVAGFMGWIDRIEPSTGKVRHFARDLVGPADRPPGQFAYSGFHQDHAGTVWIANSNGLHRYDPVSDRLSLQVDARPGREPLDNLRQVADAGKGRLWLGGRGLHRFDPLTGALESFPHLATDPTTLPGDGVTRLHFDPDGTLWVGTTSGLGRWNGEGRGFTRYVHDPSDPRSLGGNFINDILRDREGRLWIASQLGGGLSLFEDGRFRVFRHDADDPQSISVDDVWSLYQDRSGLTWIGTAGLGLNQFNPSTHRFNTLRSVPFNANSLRSSFVWDIQESADHRVWMATLAGLESYDPATGRFAAYRPLAGEVSGNQMQSLLIDGGGRFWLGSVDGRLYRFDPAEGRFTAVANPDRDDGSFSGDRIWYLGEGADGRIWTSTVGELLALDPETARVVDRIPATPQMPLGATAAIRTSLVDSEGVLWLGGGGVGLIRHEPGKGITALIAPVPGDPASLSNHNVRSLYESPDGTLWVGTLNGLNRMSAADRRQGRNRFTLVTTREGLPDNTIYGILPDPDGSLWLSSNRGLTRFEPETGAVRNFDTRDGLVGDETNGGAELLASDGSLYFGGVTGVSWFRPAQMPRNDHVPQTRISGIQVAGQPRDPGFIARNAPLQLAHGSNGVALEFAAMDFHQPGKNRFRYRLGGESGAWIDTGRNSVNLATLAPGEYRVEVLGSNNDGVWSSEPAVLDIVVAPPPWRSTAAYLLYLGLLLGALLAYDRAQRAKLRREREFNERLASAHSLVEANHQLALRHAQYDNLTQLPNRASLLDALGRSMRLARNGQRQFALLLINLDRFQRINDTIGHNLGDHILKVTAERLQAVAGRDDLLARVGSDEFALIAAQPEAAIDGGWIEALVARLVEAIGQAHVHDDPPLSVAASIGIVAFAGNDDSPSEVLGFANMALHLAKRSGGGQVRHYVPGMIESARERLSIEGRMHRALQDREFLPYFQPVIELPTRRLAGFEALIRWQPPGQAMIFPDQFIPVAEESGLIVELGDFMIDAACRQLAEWQRWDLEIAVNVSMRQLRSGTLARTIRAALAAHSVPPRCLKLEITESVMMENVGDTADQLGEIRKLGVQLSIDDFGTGFSSLSHLKLLPVDEMKIDRSFVGDVAGNRHSQKIVNSIVRLAHELQLRVVAEGVEDEAAVAFLQSVDCDRAQGYLFDRPQPAAQIVAKGWLKPGAFARKVERLALVG